MESGPGCVASARQAATTTRGSASFTTGSSAARQTAAAIGDDTLQRRARGQVVPDSFTHGTSAQRQRWFSRVLKAGTLSACNTFSAASL